MTEPGRTLRHAQANGFGTVDDYALELEDILEAIVSADRDWRNEDRYDMDAAMLRARDLVETWNTP